MPPSSLCVAHDRNGRPGIPDGSQNEGVTDRGAIPHVVTVTAEDVPQVRLAAFAGKGSSPGGVNPSDRDPGTRHFGVRIGDVLAAVGSLVPERSPRNDTEPAYRIRGMATRPEFQGQGLGGLVLHRVRSHIAIRGGGLLWGNLRLAAVPFYQRHGFTVADDVFRSDIGVDHRYGEQRVPGTG